MTRVQIWMIARLPTLRACWVVLLVLPGWDGGAEEAAGRAVVGQRGGPGQAGRRPLGWPEITQAGWRDVP